MDEPRQRQRELEALIVCVSEHHGNTRRIADAIGDVLGAAVVEPEAVDASLLRRHDLIGFGSGIYFASVHYRLADLVDRLPPGDGRCVFTFSTSGSHPLPWLGMSAFRCRLRDRGYTVLGDFNCRGLDTVGPLRLIGGLNRGHPDESDLARAERFGRGLRTRVVPFIDASGGRGPRADRSATAAPGQVPPERRFHWRSGPDRPVGAEAADLADFGRQLHRADPAAIRHHAAGHDFSRWFRGVLGQARLADRTRAVEHRLNSSDSPTAVDDAREALLAAIDQVDDG